MTMGPPQLAAAGLRMAAKLLVEQDYEPYPQEPGPSRDLYAAMQAAGGGINASYGSRLSYPGDQLITRFVGYLYLTRELRHLMGNMRSALSYWEAMRVSPDGKTRTAEQVAKHLEAAAVLIEANSSHWDGTILYLYLHSGPGLWTTGFYDPEGKWIAESDHQSPEEAAGRVIKLNGSH